MRRTSGRWIPRVALTVGLLAVAAVVGMIAILALRPKLVPAQLIGTYRCQYSYGTETLTLAADGTYAQAVTFAAGGPPATNSGRWTLDPEHDELVLHDAVVVDTGLGAPRPRPERGLWIMPVHRSLRGKVYLTVSEDLGLEFR